MYGFLYVTMRRGLGVIGDPQFEGESARRSYALMANPANNFLKRARHLIPWCFERGGRITHSGKRMLTSCAIAAWWFVNIQSSGA